jgi:RecJ-like exonuclease
MFTAMVSALEPGSSADCPNSAWEFVADANGNYCKPTGVTVTCDARQMFVTFSEKHVYKALDSIYVDQPESAAVVGDCTFVSKNSGDYSINFKLDKCGTVVTQEDSKITFSNNIVGNTDALTIQGIIMTKVLGFPVSCTYDDNFQLEIDPIYLNTGVIDIEGIHENGNFGKYFEMHAYTDDAHTNEITSLNTVYIGDKVYVRIKNTKNLPSTIDYYLTDCTAYKDFQNKSGDSFEMIDGMCYADLINTNNVESAAGGKSAGEITFDFSAFAFSDSPTQVSMQCTIKLCALGVDDAKIVSTCAVQPDSCPAGYSLD